MLPEIISVMQHNENQEDRQLCFRGLDGSLLKRGFVVNWQEGVQWFPDMRSAEIFVENGRKSKSLTITI